MRLIGSFCVYRPPLNSLWGAMGLLWLPLERHWPPFVTPWRCLWPSWGRPGAPLGSLWVALGSLWVTFGSLWAALGSLWVAWVSLLDFVENLASLSEQMWLKYHACRQKMRPRSSSAIIPGIPGVRGSGPRRAGQDLGSTRAGGKDDGSLHKLPQIINIHTRLYKTTHIYIYIYNV